MTLDCSVRKSKNPMVTWSDNVFSETSSINIFEASREGNKKNDEHDKGSHFEVDLNSLALTINGVTEEFVGSYTCRSKVGDDQFNVSYNLAVYGPLVCDHVRSTYVESEEFRFGCKLTYSGREPNLKLTKHDKQFTEEEDDQIANSFDIGEMSLQYTNTLKPEDDGQTIVCTAKMDDVEEKCNVTLDVKYNTRHATFEPEAKDIEVGQKLVCKADGNPVPDLIIHREGNKSELIKKGHGKVELDVPQSWEGETVRVHCMAENHPGNPLSVHKTIHVSSPKAGGLNSSSEGIMKPVVLILNAFMLALLSFLLH